MDTQAGESPLVVAVVSRSTPARCAVFVDETRVGTGPMYKEIPV
jgi:hypothetical protein